MTVEDNMARVRRLAEQSRQWEAQDTDPVVCPIDRPCPCPTCGLVTQMVRGKLVSRGWSREDAARVFTTAPLDTSYPYIGSVRVDKREVYRVHADLAEAMDLEVIADIEAALGRHKEKPGC